MLYAAIGEKRIAHERTGEPAIVAYVLKKGSVRRDNRLPKSIRVQMPESAKSRLIKSDVVELPTTPSAFGIRSGHVVQGFDGDIGVCSLVFRLGTRPYFLTNAHVVARVSWSSNSGRVRIFDRVTQSFFDVGVPVYISPLAVGQVATADVAAVAIKQEVVADEMRVLDFEAPIASFGHVNETSGLKYWYSVNGLLHECGYPEKVEVNAPTLVDGTQVLFTKFWQFQMIRGAAAPGQSGALLCRTVGSKIEACGLIFGGVAPSFIWAFPINRMLELVRRRITPP